MLQRELNLSVGCRALALNPFGVEASHNEGAAKRTTASCYYRFWIWRARGSQKACLQRCAGHGDRPHKLPSLSTFTLSGGDSRTLTRGYCCPGTCSLEQMQERGSDPC